MCSYYGVDAHGVKKYAAASEAELFSCTQESFQMCWTLNPKTLNQKVFLVQGPSLHLHHGRQQSVAGWISRSWADKL